MSYADREYTRQVLLEAFTAGWQAGLARNITSPRVLAMVETCFDMWLSEALDEADVLGLTFRGREDLPSLAREGPPTWAAPGRGPRHRAGPAAGADDRGRLPVPSPRAPAERAERAEPPPMADRAEPQPTEGRHPMLDLRRLLGRPSGLRGPK